MIDSIKIILPPQHFKILKPEKFNPNALLVYQKQVIKAVQTTAKNTLYLPRATLSRRMNLQGIPEIMLTIESSLPKLLFGNNLEELQLKDFDQIVRILHEKLLMMGIAVRPDNLAQADVTAIHFAKNIVLTSGATPFHYIQKIKAIKTPGHLDHNQTNYRNSGHCFKWHANSYEIVFYDKIYDLQKSITSKKRSVDYYNILNPKILKKLRAGRKKFEVLRMEVRLNKRSKIKQLFCQLKIKNDLTLRKLFRPAIARKILLHYVDLLENKHHSFLDFTTSNDQSLLSWLIFYNPKLKIKQILQYIGLKKILETMTLDELKKIVSKQQQLNLNKLLKELEIIEMPHTEKNALAQPFEIIRQQIERYKSIKLNKKS